MEPEATAIPNVIAQNNFAFFITALTWKLVAITFMQNQNSLLEQVRIDADAERGRLNRTGNRSERMFLNCDLGRLVDRDDCIHGRWRHLPEGTLAGQLYAVN